MNEQVYCDAFMDEMQKIARGPLASKAAKAAKSAKELAGKAVEKAKGKIPPRVIEFLKKHRVPLAFGGGVAASDILKSRDREKSAAEECPGGKIKSKGKGKGLGFGKGKGPVGIPKE